MEWTECAGRSSAVKYGGRIYERTHQPVSYTHLDVYKRQEGNRATYVLSYEECMDVIQSMRFGDESDLFGKEKDDSFKGSIGNIYQSFGGTDMYAIKDERSLKKY